MSKLIPPHGGKGLTCCLLEGAELDAEKTKAEGLGVRCLGTAFVPQSGTVEPGPSTFDLRLVTILRQATALKGLRRTLLSNETAGRTRY